MVGGWAEWEIRVFWDGWESEEEVFQPSNFLSTRYVFKSEFCNKKFIIWATVSSQYCFYWLNRASPSLAAKCIMNLISVLTIWYCPCVESSLMLLEEGVCYDQCILLAKLLAFELLHFVLLDQTPTVSRSISWLPAIASQFPVIKRTTFFAVSSRRSCRSS